MTVSPRLARCVCAVIVMLEVTASSNLLDDKVGDGDVSLIFCCKWGNVSVGTGRRITKAHTAGRLAMHRIAYLLCVCNLTQLVAQLTRHTLQLIRKAAAHSDL
ncbi:hypothetical protein K437DRAFT_142579 [Tilletiaria anomala UBC 951]|uniref:Secreted protein n=1 Tax=Tilletiaria anomala (strain ATCC 24038 / CBS 436.72 / UBC 951) TaxID=1037660 RepID=A0A066VQQ5_TILAU|nr:uncharacterized protein K437DRAFT_142579 [Tilletiaria anomala UBC 951]KDN44077.1 hypothetical protein K437DRAFT_142579 [Tilletiaria anomala UBC 951]